MLKWLLPLLVLLIVAPAQARPIARAADAQQFARDVATNLGGGTVTTCVRHGRYIVKCRADLTSEPCHVWAQIHFHNGALYSIIPRYAYCGEWGTPVLISPVE